MNFVPWLELGAAIFGAGFAGWSVYASPHKPRRPASILLVLLLSLMALVHAADALEWFGLPMMDRIGDSLRILVPLFWVLALFARHREELDARVSEGRHQLAFLMDRGPLAVCVFELSGEVLEVSSYWARRAGVTVAECKGRPFAALPGVPQTLIQAVFRQVSSGPSRTQSTTPLLCEWKGCSEWVDWYAHTHPGTQAGTGHVTLVVQFVTERHQRELKENEATSRLYEEHRVELVGQLAVTVAHDLNNLLQVISTNAELLPPDGPDPSVTEAREGIMAASQSATNLVRSLNGLARERGRKGSVDLLELVESTLHLIKRTLPSQVTADSELEQAHLTITGDRSRLQQMVMNLLVNAKDAVSAGGKIHVRLAAGGDHAILEVEDTGKGIPPSIRARIFDPFFTTKQATDGTGLGLALVQSVAAEHGGSIAVESAPDEGARFRVTLPLDTPEPEVPNDTTDQVA